MRIQRSVDKKYKAPMSHLVLVLFALGWGFFVLGKRPLNIFDTGWLWGDLAQTYVAWVQYHADPSAKWLISNRMSWPLSMNFSLFDPMPLLLVTIVRIPLKLDTHSTANWSAIPRQTGQSFQTNLITSERSDAGLFGFYAETSAFVNLLRFLRCDSPLSFKICALCTNRSSMASASVASPIASCQ